MWWHALPEGWEYMGYQEFLQSRRDLIAKVTREGFKKLSDPNYRPQVPLQRTEASAPALPSFDELVRAGAVPPGTLLVPADGETNSIAEVTENAMIRLNDVEHRTPDLAAHADGADEADGWDYWAATFDEPVTLSELRTQPLLVGG